MLKFQKQKTILPTEYTYRNQSFQLVTSNTILKIIYKRVREYLKHNSKYFAIRHTIIACHRASQVKLDPRYTCHNMQTWNHAE